MKRLSQDFARAARLAAAGSACALAACGSSHSPARAPTSSFPFELVVREVRTETIYRADDDSLSSARFESSLVFFGRVVAHTTDASEIVTVHADSVEFASGAPFRFTARILPDTVKVTSGARGPATSTGMLESDRAMLACLFGGPALRIVFPAESGRDAAAIEDLISGCAGGLYRRLHLAVTLGAFVFDTARGEIDPPVAWQTIETRPSFSELGQFPQLRWSYRIAGGGEESDARDSRIEIACDTTLARVRTTLPDGETADVIADRIHVRGSVRPWPGLPFFQRGTIRIEEDIRYVRPEIGPSVLDKSCSVEITFERR